MMDALSAALNGIKAGSTRLAVSANNVANMQSTTTEVDGNPSSTPFVPQRVDQVSLSSGGVAALVKAMDPASVARFDPQSIQADASGMVQFPNVSLEDEAINQKIATYDIKANINVIKTTDKMQQNLLDIFS